MKLKEVLDTRICDVVETATNTQTYREFIRYSEQQFEMMFADLDNISEEELSDYLDFLGYLWTK